MRKTRHIGKNKWVQPIIGCTKRENTIISRKRRPYKSRLSSKRLIKPFHEEFIPRTPDNRVAEILSVDGLVVTFRTESGVTYKLDFDKTSEYDRSFRKQIENQDFFNTIKVKHGDFAFMDKNEPIKVAYPEGDREEIGYFHYYTIEDRMFLLEKISD